MAQSQALAAMALEVAAIEAVIIPAAMPGAMATDEMAGIMEIILPRSAQSQPINIRL